jgi:hypothetical protein
LITVADSRIGNSNTASTRPGAVHAKTEAATPRSRIGNFGSSTCAPVRLARVNATGAITAYPNLLSGTSINLTGANLTIKGETRAKATLAITGSSGTYGCATGSTITLSGASNTITGACTIKTP